MIVVGYGTGRCGTKSLAMFLDQQPGFNVTHEGVVLGWYQAVTDMDKALEQFLSRNETVIGDIGFYWIHYACLLLRRHIGTKVINITRPDEEVIESFWRRKEQHAERGNSYSLDLWTGYPFDSPRMTKDAVRQTILRYRFLENTMFKTFPGLIYRLEMEDLNRPKGLEMLLDWLGVKDKVLATYHENKSIESAPKGVRPLIRTLSKENTKWHQDDSSAGLHQ